MWITYIFKGFVVLGCLAQDILSLYIYKKRKGMDNKRDNNSLKKNNSLMEEVHWKLIIMNPRLESKSTI